MNGPAEVAAEQAANDLESAMETTDQQPQTRNTASGSTPLADNPVPDADDDSANRQAI